MSVSLDIVSGAKEPTPASATAGVAPASALFWRPLRELTAIVTTLVILCLGTVAACAGALNLVAAETIPPDPPPSGDFLGAWCSPLGDVLALQADDRFTAGPLSAALSAALTGRLVRDGRPAGPPTAGAGRWEVWRDDGAVLIELAVEELDGTAGGESVRFSVSDDGGVWALHLPLRPSGHLPFNRCPTEPRAPALRPAAD